MENEVKEDVAMVWEVPVRQIIEELSRRFPDQKVSSKQRYYENAPTQHIFLIDVYGESTHMTFNDSVLLEGNLTTDQVTAIVDTLVVQIEIEKSAALATEYESFCKSCEKSREEPWSYTQFIAYRERSLKAEAEVETYD
jgi:hypothetical protein